MRIPILTFGAIASILTINSVMADTVVTSRNYVDTQDALKQDKITAGTTGSVVTYNGTQNGQAQFSERAIFDPLTGYDVENREVVSGHEGDLMTAGLIVPVVDSLAQGPANTVAMYDPDGFLGNESRGIYDGSTIYNSSTDSDKLVTASALQNVSYEINNMPTKNVTYKTCTRWVDGQSHTDENCLLWNLVDKTVYAPQCVTLADCVCDGIGGYFACSGGRCIGDCYYN